MSPLKDLLQLEQYLYQLGERLFSELNGSESMDIYLDAENSLFIRFNEARIRQSTEVEQAHLGLEYHCRGKKQTATLSLCGSESLDWQKLLESLGEFRRSLEFIPEDPFLVPMSNGGVSRAHYGGQLPEAQECVEDILTEVNKTDFVGLFTKGPVAEASLNSKGQKHWFSNDIFSLDYSLFNEQRKAVKGSFAGTNWDKAKLSTQLESEKVQLQSLLQKELKIPRGKYPVYLAPMAMAELAGHLCWGSFGLRAKMLGHSPMKEVQIGEEAFSSKLNLSENFDLAMGPRFNKLGEVRPDKLPLVQKGRLENLLVSGRSSIEYGLPSNRANPSESLSSLEILPGQLQEEDILKRLDKGLYLSNLHYLNWSDQPKGRVTGMTRYACFWVEKGEIVAPFSDLRFDESIFDCLGKNLKELTAFSEDFPSTSTYGQRKLGGIRVPGALIDDFTFTL